MEEALVSPTKRLPDSRRVSLEFVTAEGQPHGVPQGHPASLTTHPHPVTTSPVMPDHEPAPVPSPTSRAASGRRPPWSWWAGLIVGGVVLGAFWWWPRDQVLPERRVAQGLEQLAAGTLDEPTLAGLVDLTVHQSRVRGFAPLFRGALATARGNPQEGLQALREFQPGEASRQALLMTLAQTLQSAGQLHEAAQVYQEVLKFNERSLPARYALSDYWYQRGAITRAMYELEQITRIDPSQSRAWSQLGQYSLDFGLLPDAERQLRNALNNELHGKSRRQICIDLGMCLFQQRNYEEAVEILTQASPSPAADAYRAEALAALGRDDESRAALAEAQALGPTERTVRLATARLALLASEPKLALPPLQAGLEDNPHDRDFQFQLSQAWAALGDTAQADAARARFAELDRLADRYSELNTQAGGRPNDIALRQELALLAEQLGRTPQAEAWRRAARLIEQQQQQPRQ